MAITEKPKWFNMSENVTLEIMQIIADSANDTDMPLQVKNLPMKAHWFICDSLYLANMANREGMHANALALTRQCIEAISVLEVGLCKLDDAAEILQKWDDDKLTAGGLRKWLEINVWPKYGNGLWVESWQEFMAKLAKAIQPYSHYSSKLSQWQDKLHAVKKDAESPDLFLEIRPRAYDPQKATRITLYHAILVFALGRIAIAHSENCNTKFKASVNRLGKALGETPYLDGHQTDWEQQFWAMMFSKKGGTILE